MIWRYNETTHIFEISNDLGVSYIVAPLNASILNEGLVNQDRLGSGHIAFGASKFLREDQTWQNVATEAFPVGAVFIGVVSTNPNTLLGYGTWSAFGTGRVLVGIDGADPSFTPVEATGGAKTHNHTGPSHTHTGPSHTHTYTDVVNHTHTISITDPGHTHTYGLTGWTTAGQAGSSEAGNFSTPTVNTGSNTTGITASSANPAGGVATGTTAASGTGATGASGTGNTSSDSNLMPYIVVYFWKRTA